MRDECEHLSLDELIQEFARCARTRGYAVLELDSRLANRCYKKMKRIDDVLRKKGTEARRALIPLLEDKDRYVRYYAAEKLLGFVPELAQAVMKENAELWFDALASDARGLLRAVESGRYRPD